MVSVENYGSQGRRELVDSVRLPREIEGMGEAREKKTVQRHWGIAELCTPNLQGEL